MERKIGCCYDCRYFQGPGKCLKKSRHICHVTKGCSPRRKDDLVKMGFSCWCNHYEVKK